MKINERLLSLIKIRLKSALKNAEILPHGDSIYILNTESKEWYFILSCNGQMRYNNTFFDLTFLLFSMNQDVYSKILKTILENSLEIPVRTTQRVGSDLSWEVDIILSKKRLEWTLSKRFGFPYFIVKKYLDYKKMTNNQKWYFVELI